MKRCFRRIFDVYLQEHGCVVCDMCVVCDDVLCDDGRNVLCVCKSESTYTHTYPLPRNLTTKAALSGVQAVSEWPS